MIHNISHNDMKVNLQYMTIRAVLNRLRFYKFNSGH